MDKGEGILIVISSIAFYVVGFFIGLVIGDNHGAQVGREQVFKGQYECKQAFDEVICRKVVSDED